MLADIFEPIKLNDAHNGERAVEFLNAKIKSHKQFLIYLKSIDDYLKLNQNRIFASLIKCKIGGIPKVNIF